jgi:hypothetical protein
MHLEPGELCMQIHEDKSTLNNAQQQKELKEKSEKCSKEDSEANTGIKFLM